MQIMSKQDTHLSKIEQLLESANTSDRSIVGRELVRQWMREKDCEVMGALYCLLMNPSICGRIEPPLTRAEVFEYLKKYYRMCIREDPRGQWVSSRYEAGWDLAKYLRICLTAKDRSFLEARELASLLQELYEGGGREIRSCIETAVLEHVMHESCAREVFWAWWEKPGLAQVLQAAQQRKIEPF
jgi:hypothetical protein